MATLPDSPARYAATTRFLHWLVALMVIATIPIGNAMLTPGLDRATQNLLFILHKNGGVILLVLVLLRLVWRWWRPAPPPLPGTPDWQVKAASWAHRGLYALLLVMAVSGYVRVVAGGFPIEMLDALGAPRLVPRSDGLARAAQTVHGIARFPLVALILLHIGAAVMHALRRDGTFARIWPPVGAAR